MQAGGGLPMRQLPRTWLAEGNAVADGQAANRGMPSNRAPAQTLDLMQGLEHGPGPMQVGD